MTGDSHWPKGRPVKEAIATAFGASLEQVRGQYANRRHGKRRDSQKRIDSCRKPHALRPSDVCWRFPNLSGNDMGAYMIEFTAPGAVPSSMMEFAPNSTQP
jgi:hypothetical protein